MKILHVLGQRLERTGSGIYLHAIMCRAQAHGYSNHMLAGIPAGQTPDLENLTADDCSYVRFEKEYKTGLIGSLLHFRRKPMLGYAARV